MMNVVHHIDLDKMGSAMYHKCGGHWPQKSTRSIPCLPNAYVEFLLQKKKRMVLHKEKGYMVSFPHSKKLTCHEAIYNYVVILKGNALTPISP